MEIILCKFLDLVKFALFIDNMIVHMETIFTVSIFYLVM